MIPGNWWIRSGEHEEGRAKTIPWQGKRSSFGSGWTSMKFIWIVFAQTFVLSQKFKSEPREFYNQVETEKGVTAFQLWI